MLAAGGAGQTLELTPREMFYKPEQPSQPPKPKPKPPGPRRNGVKLIRVSADQTPLGLKYAVVKVADQTEVPAGTLFHTGDHIQLRVEANASGYLYIVNRGTSGDWKVLFPAATIDGGRNSVAGFRPVTLPSEKDQITFRNPPGVERLFIVLSRQPVSDLDRLIYSLKGDPATLVAQAAIDDPTIAGLRLSVRPRDLIVEPVTPGSSADATGRQESATYVLSAPGSADSRLIADVQLKHQ